MRKKPEDCNANGGYITITTKNKNYAGHCRMRQRSREDTRDDSTPKTLTSWHAHMTLLLATLDLMVTPPAIEVIR